MHVSCVNFAYDKMQLVYFQNVNILAALTGWTSCQSEPTSDSLTLTRKAYEYFYET